MPEIHHIYGPSTLKNRELCPGWQNDNDGDKTYADEGTLMHLAAETGDLSILQTEEQRDCVKKVLDYVEPLERAASRIIKERRLSILGGLTFGTADRVILSAAHPKIADVIDFKFGRSSIDDAEVNRQGMAYALGVFEEFDCDSVIVHFLIPRRDEVSKYTFKCSDIPRLQLIVKTIIARAEHFRKTLEAGSPDVSMLNPSEEACLYCGFKSQCPAVQSYALTLAKKYEPLEIVDEVHSSQVTVPEQMSKMLIAARVMEKWAASVKKHAMTLVEEGGVDIPGFEIRQRSGSVEVSNPVAAFEVMEQFGLTPIEMVSCGKLNKGAIEKLIGEKAEHGKKAGQIRKLNAALASAECLTTGEPIRFLQKIRE